MMEMCLFLLACLALLLPIQASTNRCCYSGCGVSVSCNAPDSWCSQSIANCNYACLGTLCSDDDDGPAQMESVKLHGRWYKNGSAVAASWGTATFVVRFTGSTRIAATMTNRFVLYYMCTVDDGVPVRLAHQDGDLVIATGLDVTAVHTVSCGRDSEASYGETVLSDIVLDKEATLLEPPGVPPKSIRYLAIGDSITAGYKVTEMPGNSADATPENESVFLTYAAHLAKAFGADKDWRVMSRSGISLTDLGNGERVMEERFLCQGFYWTDCPSLWGFADGWEADVVTINLGTNDYAFGNPSRSEVAAATISLVSQIREVYKDALIALIEPLQISCAGGEEKWTRLGLALRDAAVVLESDDPKVHFYPTGSVAEPWLTCATDYIDWTHPTIGGNIKFADRLLERMTGDVRAAFPEKCNGIGTRCDQIGSPPPVSTPIPTQSPTPVPSSAPTPSGGGENAVHRCCYYLGCEVSDLDSNCNAADTWCSLSAANCESVCKGTLCEFS